MNPDRTARPAEPSSAIHLKGRTIPLAAGESVLEGLERAGIEAPSGCRAGTCCKCMLQGEDPPAMSQRSLRPTLRAQGFFLACQAYPIGTLELSSGEAPEPIDTVIQSVEAVAPDVARILLRPEDSFAFRPGQYLDVLHPSGALRSYSIASLPSDQVLELHVRRIANGLVSSWIHEQNEGQRVQIRGPFGQCFHVADDEQKRLLLVGAGTGLAPLLGIARDALEQGHKGSIKLVHGGLQPDRLYMRPQLSELAETWPNLEVEHCVLREATEQEHEGPLDQVAIRLAGSLENTRAFLCGDAEIVRLLQRSLFLAGISSAEMFADPFSPASP